MRIGLDCRILNREPQRAGVANYTYHLFKNILASNVGQPAGQRNEYVLFWDKEPLPEFSAVEGVGHVSMPGKTNLPLVNSHFSAAKKFDQEKLDLVHFPSGLIPATLKTGYVATVHDLAILRHSEWFPTQPLSALLTPKLWQRADHLIAVSNFTEDELRELLKVPLEKISVIYEGVGGATRIQAKAPSLSGYFLFIGTIEPRKNLDGLLDAFEILKEDEPSAQLVVLGKEGWRCEKIIERLKTTSGVTWPGYVSEEEKIGWLRNAIAMVYPSLYEGFGLPVLEAMAAGVPVITSDGSSLKEVAGDAAVLVDPKDPEKMAEAMEKVWHHRLLGDSLKQKGPRRAAQFTWFKAAEETVAVYSRVVANAKA